MKEQKKDERQIPGRKLIKGVGVQIDSPDIQSAQSVEDLKKLEIFSTVPLKQQDEAYEELWNEIKVKNQEEEND